MYLYCVSVQSGVFTLIRIAVKLNQLGELTVVRVEAQDVVRISGSATRRHSGRIP